MLLVKLTASAILRFLFLKQVVHHVKDRAKMCGQTHVYVYARNQCYNFLPGKDGKDFDRNNKSSNNYLINFQCLSNISNDTLLKPHPFQICFAAVSSRFCHDTIRCTNERQSLQDSHKSNFFRVSRKSLLTQKHVLLPTSLPCTGAE